jgi:hypothetical protein
MPDSKRRDEDQNLFPVLQYIDRGQCSNKENMIESALINDMLPSELEIEFEIAHVQRRLQAISYKLQARSFELLVVSVFHAPNTTIAKQYTFLTDLRAACSEKRAAFN